MDIRPRDIIVIALPVLLPRFLAISTFEALKNGSFLNLPRTSAKHRECLTLQHLRPFIRRGWLAYLRALQARLVPRCTRSRLCAGRLPVMGDR